MGLSKELIQQFVKATNDLQEQNSETFVLGTAVISDGNTYVKIDGSESLTPIKTTTKVNQGDRVTVMIKNHTATITGNITSPSVDKNVVENKIDEFGTIIANDIIAQNGKIDNLIAENVTIKGNLTAVNAEIENLTAENVNINGKLTANEAEIEDLKVKKLDVETAKIEFATIENLNATNVEVNNIKGNFADFSQLTAEDLKAINANIKNLQAEKLNANEAEIKYANIDFANIGMAAIEKLFADSGIIKDLVVNDQHITGELVGVTIKGDLIEGNTIVADKLVVKGSDGLYYKLNTDGMKIEAEQTEYNSLNGSIITAKSITASKVMVDDLVAFDATIGGFKITDSSIYSGVKESATNTTRGIYLDKTGQVSFGDANNFLKFFKDTDGVWKLAISANSIKLSASSTDLGTAFDDINNKVQNTTKSIEEQFAISNSSTTAPTSGWSTTPPTWQNGKYIWSKTITTYTDGRISESKPVCITGAKGETGASGSSGKGIKSVTNYYLATTLSTGVTESTSGWTTTAQTMTPTNKYLWNYEVITYTDTSTTKTTPVIIGVYGDKGATGSTGATGATGNGIKSIQEKYAVSTSNKTAPTTWYDAVQVMTTTNKYLWNYEIITYTNGSTSETSKRVIGVYGDKGNTGATGATGPAGPAGVGVQSIDVEYYLSTSPTSQVGGSWSTTAPTWVDGKYIWTRTKTVTTDNKTTTTSPVCITGGKGNTGSTGATGDTGTGIASITEEYYLSTSKTTQSGGSWVTTPPTWSTGKYIWTRSKIVYKNPTSTVYTTPICDNSWEAVNEVQVGGRNLALGTGTAVGDVSAGTNGYPFAATDLFNGITAIKTNTSWTGRYFNLRDIAQRGGFKAGDSLVISVYVKSDQNVTLNITCHRTMGTGNIAGSSKSYKNFTITPKWQQVWFPFVADEGSLNRTDARIEVNVTTDTNHIYWAGWKLEKGNKPTDWTPAPEDIEKRVADAELKIEPGKITATVEDQIKKNGSTILATISYVIQESDKVIYKFTSTAGQNRVKNGAFQNGTTHWSKWNIPVSVTVGTSKLGYKNSVGIETNGANQGLQQTVSNLKIGQTYTLSAYVSISSGSCQLQVENNGTYAGAKSSGTGAQWLTVTFTAKATSVTVFIGRGSGGSNGKYYFTAVQLQDGEIKTAWVPHPSEIYDGCTMIDSSGVTITNGALTVKNKAGQTVLSGDSDGNLSLTGSLVVSSNKNQILRVDTADTKYPHMVIDAYGPYMDQLSVTSDYTGYAQQKAVDGVFIRNNRLTIYGSGETFWMQGNARITNMVTCNGSFQGKDFSLGESSGDRVLDSPWYGLGRSTNTSGGGRMVQLSGYYGLLFKTAGTTISVPSNGNISITGSDVITMNNSNSWKGLDLYRYGSRARYGIGSDGTGGDKNFPVIECWNSGASGYASRLEIKNSVLQWYNTGGSFKAWTNFGSHGGISVGNNASGYLKWLRGHSDIQCRNYSDNAYTRINASVFVVNSQEKAKENIIDLDIKKAIDILMSNEIKEYNLINERKELEQVVEEADARGYVLDLEMVEPDKHCGLILDHLTEDATNILQPGRTDGIDVYAMASLLWKVCQDQQNRITELADKTSELEERIKQLELR